MKKGIELSLNEYEALLNKAAVGSGLPWGIAEDAAACGAWFMSCGINKLDTWIDRLKDNSFWIDYCKKIDQPDSNNLNNIFDLASTETSGLSTFKNVVNFKLLSAQIPYVPHNVYGDSANASSTNVLIFDGLILNILG